MAKKSISNKCMIFRSDGGKRWNSAVWWKTVISVKDGVKLHVDLSNKRFKFLLDTQKYVENVGEVQFVYADVNCN